MVAVYSVCTPAKVLTGKSHGNPVVWSGLGRYEVRVGGCELLTRDRKVFHQLVKLVNNLERNLGLEIADSICGLIHEPNVAPMLEFVKENPEFHVVSVVNSLYVNRYVAGAGQYFIATGSPDPSIKYLSPILEALTFLHED